MTSFALFAVRFWSKAGPCQIGLTTNPTIGFNRIATTVDLMRPNNSFASHSLMTVALKSGFNFRWKMLNHSKMVRYQQSPVACLTDLNTGEVDNNKMHPSREVGRFDNGELLVATG